MSTKEGYVVTLMAMPGDDRPAIVRMKAMLKYAIRACRLRCTEIKETSPSPAKENKCPNQS